MPSHLFGVLRGESVKWHSSEDELETRWSLFVLELALLPSRIDMVLSIIILIFLAS